MTWLRELISDNKTKRLSSARFVAVVAGITLSIATLALTAIAFWEVGVVPALVVSLGGITTLATGNYVVQKLSDKNDRNEQRTQA